MYRPRLIPIILLDGVQAVKTIKFAQRINLGDPVNLISILSAFEVDEIVLLDIEATVSGRSFDLGLFNEIASEATVPFSFGGGVQTLSQIETLLASGAEKVVLSSIIHSNPHFLTDAVNKFGSSSISACLDVKKNNLGNLTLYYGSGRNKVSENPIDVARYIEELGVGEVIIQSIDCDGTMNGYDIETLSRFSEFLRVPVVALGGAGTLEHMIDVYKSTEVSALASGSFFTFKGQGRGVLPSYPTTDELNRFVGLK